MVNEKKLVADIEDYFQEMRYVTATEIPLFENRIDVVAHPDNLSEIVAVEAKVNKWFRALQQAILYRICADKVYIAISNHHVQCVDKGLLKRFGVGLLEVDGIVRESLSPNPSKYITHQAAREAVINSLSKDRG
jgi:hypothetical protein